MSQSFRTHRMFQLLSWVDALSRGYDSPGTRHRPADSSLVGEPHRPPTISNLAYYLLTEAEYNMAALTDRFSSRAVRSTPTSDVFTHVKRDLTRHLAQYPGDLLTPTPVQKTPADHPTFEADLESRRVEAKAYYLTERGLDRLAELTDVMEFKRELLTTRRRTTRVRDHINIVSETHVLTDAARDRLADEGVSTPIETDSITVPLVRRRRWTTQTYCLPHINVRDRSREPAPTMYRD